MPRKCQFHQEDGRFCLFFGRKPKSGKVLGLPCPVYTNSNCEVVSKTELALDKMAEYYVRPHKGHGGCSVCPIEGPKCPGWDKIAPNKMCAEAIKQHFLKLAEGKKK